MHFNVLLYRFMKRRRLRRAETATSEMNIAAWRYRNLIFIFSLTYWEEAQWHKKLRSEIVALNRPSALQASCLI